VLDSEQVELVVQKKLVELLDTAAGSVKAIDVNGVVCDVFVDGSVLREITVQKDMFSQDVTVGDQFRITFDVEGDVWSDVAAVSYADDITSLCSTELRDVVVDAFYVWGAGAERVESYLRRCGASEEAISSIIK